MKNLSDYFFAGFLCADDIAVFADRDARDNWVIGFSADSDIFDTIIAEDRIPLTLDDVRDAFMPCEDAPSADEQIIAAIEEATPDEVDDRILWLTFD